MQGLLRGKREEMKCQTDWYRSRLKLTPSTALEGHRTTAPTPAAAEYIRLCRFFLYESVRELSLCFDFPNC